MNAASTANPARRQLLASGALASAALLLTHRAASAQEPIAYRPAVSPVGYNPTASWKSSALRLARRVTLGVTQDDAKLALKLGYQKYLEYQLNYEAIDDTAVETWVKKQYPTLSLTPFQINAYVNSDKKLNNAETDAIKEATLYRSIHSKRQLYQRMVEFWSDHFNTWPGKGEVGLLKTKDDTEVIRKHALGFFPDLLRASAHSAAMLDYLDNVTSRGDGKPAKTPNQNYARELMELHTLGVNGGYTQQDVLEVARCLTGWTYQRDRTKADYGAFAYNPKWHDMGEKNALGHIFPATANVKAADAGYSDGEEVFNILAAHPSTAKFIATKLTHWLLRYDPSEALVKMVADEYLRTGGDIKAMIRVILQESNLVAAPAKYKRPYHLLVSALRTAAPTVPDWAKFLPVLRGQLSVLGQSVFGWEPPNGYPDALGYWAGLILPRWNFGFALATETGVANVPVSGLLTAKSAADVLDALDAQLFAGELPEAEETALAAYLTSTLGKSGKLTDAHLRDTFGLALATPNFQWY